MLSAIWRAMMVAWVAWVAQPCATRRSTITDPAVGRTYAWSTWKSTLRVPVAQEYFQIRADLRISTTDFTIASGFQPFRVCTVDEAIEARISKGREVITAQIELLHRSFGQTESHWKHDGTRVTPIDLEISEQVFSDLALAFPEDHLCSEESDPGIEPLVLTGRFTWILDPVDGTNNYALGIPMVAISLALLENGEPAYGFIYDLGARTLTHGGPGLGLWIDDLPVERREPDGLDVRVVGLHSPVDAQHKPVVDAVVQGCKIRAYGSGALHLTYVALGRIDACLDFTIKIWDIAAAVALCRASGIDIQFLSKSPFPAERFDVCMKPTPYLAARPKVLAELKVRLLVT